MMSTLAQNIPTRSACVDKANMIALCGRNDKSRKM